MRTTLSIDDQLLAAAKKRARVRGVTLGSYVEDAIRRQLSEPDNRTAGPQIPVFTRGTGMKTGVDAASNHSLFDALDASADLS
jgi:Arc/MetJ family transcription regulator